MKTFIIIVIIVGAIVAGFLYIRDKSGLNTNTSSNLPGIGSIETKVNAEKQLAISAAKELWRAKKLEGADFSNGPCLSNSVIPNWVADIAHNPRTEVDDAPENQCNAYREGAAKHFVELDAGGNVIRAQ
jgi:hypothetical protein